MQTITLTADHPGFHDSEYRQRRNAIAAMADLHREGAQPPTVEYTASEHATWATAWQQLRPLQRNRVCSQILIAQERLRLWEGGIPQLTSLDTALSATDFRMTPVAGLVAAPEFLRALANGVFLSTQYVRHASRPDYTPEPDVIHEMVGHAASLTVPEIADLSRAFGRAAQTASPTRLLQLERLYWFTLEFGAVIQDGIPHAVGAGLLSSVEELKNLASVAIPTWSPERLATTPYDPTTVQPTIFAAPSWRVMIEELQRWLGRTDHA